MYRFSGGWLVRRQLTQPYRLNHAARGVLHLHFHLCTSPLDLELFVRLRGIKNMAVQLGHSLLGGFVRVVLNKAVALALPSVFLDTNGRTLDRAVLRELQVNRWI